MLLCELRKLGWDILDDALEDDGRWCVLANRDCHFIVALANTREIAAEVAGTMAIQLALRELISWP